MSQAEDNPVYADLNALIALQYQAKGFSFLPKQSVHSILSGRHASRLRGRGLNFEELRHYRAGDDIRTMDWKVTNRTGKPHVRVYTEERERPVLLVIDQRMSMFFGSTLKMKSVLACEMAALAGWRVLDVGDRIGAVVFNDSELSEIRPKRSQRNIMQILNKAVELNHQLDASYPHPPSKKHLNIALSHVEKVVGHDYLVVIVSDMYGWDAETLKRIKRLSRHNDVLTSMVYDELEVNLPEKGRFVVSDGDMQILLDVKQKGVVEGVQQEFYSSLDELKNELSLMGIPILPICTQHELVDQVRSLIGTRTR